MKRIPHLMLSLALLLAIPSCSDEPASPESSASRNDGGLLKQTSVFVAHLSGMNSSATGQAIFRVSADGMSISYQLIVANIVDVTQAHIHLAPVGVNGPVIVWLYPSSPPAAAPAGPVNGMLASGTITASNLVGPMLGSSIANLVSAMAAGTTYVNVHTTVNPAGEIRGQIQ
jgi:hypothetical protein